MTASIRTPFFSANFGKFNLFQLGKLEHANGMPFSDRSPQLCLHDLAFRQPCGQHHRKVHQNKNVV